MKRWLINLTLFGMFFGLILGWFRADVGQPDAVSLEDEWTSLERTDIEAGRYAQLTRRLSSSRFFARSFDTEADTNEFLDAEGNKLAPPFPKIVGASRLNGVPHVHLLLPDNTFVKGKSGDILANGWELLLVDSERVTAVYEGQEKEFLVADYQ